MRISAIKNITRSLLEDTGLYSVPVNLDHLTKALDIHVLEINDIGLSGYALQKDGVKYIGVNVNESEPRKRFTVGHELGHLFLHRETDINYDQGGLMMLRDDNSSTGDDIKEVEANRFAAELLMPEDLLTQDINEMKNSNSFDMDSDEYINTISLLAKKYDVSTQAMNIRLSSLYFSR